MFLFRLPNQIITFC